MTYSGSTEGFLSAGRVLISQTLAQLRLAQRTPLTITCTGEARYLDPELERWAFERSVCLGACDSLVDAMMLVSTRLGSGDVACSDDPALRFTPKLIAVVDADQGLVLAGEVANGGVTWLQPVASDAEARAVVTLACSQRAEAQHLADMGKHADASLLRRRAAAAEGRLVDPFWRDAAQLALLQRRAA
ncbi:hypothetical protein CDV50_17440 [Haematobacter massiliensis]|uniref:Uncharacterized protein n=2 Tax=Haematobacter TaxID=366614 RepID=A0A086XTY9_9RHOB|nr:MULTISPECIES: hypothetical protein [Haematobacter]KFI25489.1 hypothetical protein CN97_08125 [Haematobacter massiliensis]OWJ69548.1 hypothetical protein CDV50_17440 [Haematobacter massiliensis]OWJ74967.1 hypothetical protein CDV49_18315 [Haematobacter genomosp. 1]OWJ82622.1 hypothetical protein CDV51_17530 [Haematobacter massiliensis]